MKIRLAISPCPNDTFAFEALLNGRIDTEGLEFETTLADIQQLNNYALAGEFDVCKVSYSAFFGFCDQYAMLKCGSALGYNVGPLLVCSNESLSKNFDAKNSTIAIPGKGTTAYLLLRHLFPEATNTSELIFSEIEQAVINGKFDAGVLIHEGRFTYSSKGLYLINDLGELWQNRYSLPIPLGGISVKRSLSHLHEKLNRILQRSIEFAIANPSLSTDYIRANAQEMSEDVQRKHIELYVNRDTYEISKEGRDAVSKLFSTAIDANMLKEAQINMANNLFIL